MHSLVFVIDINIRENLLLNQVSLKKSIKQQFIHDKSQISFLILDQKTFVVKFESPQESTSFQTWLELLSSQKQSVLFFTTTHPQNEEEKQTQSYRKPRNES